MQLIAAHPLLCRLTHCLLLRPPAPSCCFLFYFSFWFLSPSSLLSLLIPAACLFPSAHHLYRLSHLTSLLTSLYSPRSLQPSAQHVQAGPLDRRLPRRGVRRATPGPSGPLNPRLSCRSAHPASRSLSASGQVIAADEAAEGSVEERREPLCLHKRSGQRTGPAHLL